MAINASHENRFYAHAMAGFLDATKRRKNMESNFDRSRIREYKEICDEQIEYAVELLKIGTECEYKDEKINILTDNGELVEIAAGEIKERLGDANFFILFPPEKGNEEETDPDLEMDDLETDSYRKNENNIVPSMEDLQKAMLFNPMAMMIPMMMNSIQTMQKNWDQTIEKTVFQGDPIAAIQEQMENLKESKARIKKKAIQYKAEYEKLCRENEEMDQVASENEKAHLKEKKAFEQTIEDLTAKLSESEDVLVAKEQELESVKSQVLRNKNADDEGKREADEKIKFLSEEIDKGKKKIEELNEILAQTQDNLDKQLGELSASQQRLDQKKEEVNRKELELQQVKGQLAHLKDVESKMNELEDRIASLTNEKQTIQQEKDAISEKLTNSEIHNNELLNKLNNAAGNQDANKKRLENEINNLKNKNQDYARKANESDNARKKAEEKYEKILAELEALKEENSILKEAAYRDPKFEVGNALGFHERVNNKDKDLKYVAMVDVCGMKDINEEYEETIGDKVIKLTIEALYKEFGNANVFRVRGAQFAIAFTEGAYGQIRKQLERVKDFLKTDSHCEFDVVYGLASLERSSSRQDMVDKARDAMKKMKNNWDLFNKPSSSAEQQVQETFVQNAQSGDGYIPDIPESTPVNPNIDMNILNDPYSDVETVTELDATSLDLANDIMEKIRTQEQG